MTNPTRLRCGTFAVFVLNLDGAIIETSPEAEAFLTGVCLQPPCSFLEVWDHMSGGSSEIAALAGSALQEARKQAGRTVALSLMLAGGTSQRCWELRMIRKEMPEGPAICVLQEEVTENCRRMRRLAESEGRYRRLVEGSADIIYEHDMEGRFVTLNGAVERILGYDRQHALGLRIDQVVTPESLDSAIEMIARKQMDPGLTTTYEIEVLDKSGRRRLMETSTCLVVEDGKPVGVQGVAREIKRPRSTPTSRLS